MSRTLTLLIFGVLVVAGVASAPRVWPGGLLVDGEIVGTWRRSQGTVTVRAWRRLSRAARHAVEAEAESLPLPGTEGRIVVRWEDLR